MYRDREGRGVAVVRQKRKKRRIQKMLLLTAVTKIQTILLLTAVLKMQEIIMMIMDIALG